MRERPDREKMRPAGDRPDQAARGQEPWPGDEDRGQTAEANCRQLELVEEAGEEVPRPCGPAGAVPRLLHQDLRARPVVVAAGRPVFVWGFGKGSFGVGGTPIYRPR